MSIDSRFSRFRLRLLSWTLLALALLASTAGAAAAAEIESFSIGPESVQAGSRADSITSFRFPVGPVPGVLGEPGVCVPAGCKMVKGGNAKNIVIDLPRGFVGNPQAIPQCNIRQLVASRIQCPPASQVGMADIPMTLLGSQLTFKDQPVFNLVPERGELAELGMNVLGVVPVLTHFRLRPDDYGLTAEVRNVDSGVNVAGTDMTVWGVPNASIHDAQRPCWVGKEKVSECLVPGPWKGFLTAPTQCNVDNHGRIAVNTYQDPNHFEFGAAKNQEVSGCNQLEFEPTIEAKATNELADAPTGLDFHLHMTQNDDPEGLATAPLRDAVVTLPVGMTVNPPSAAGLGACTMQEVGISSQAIANGNPIRCPETAKIGTVTAISPTLENPVEGAVYLATPHENPFGSLLALYLVLEEPERGLRVKMAGEVKSDPQTGQLTTVFTNSPQLPVSDLELHLKTGPRAPLRTPASCGSFTTTSTLTPWTAPEGPTKSPSAEFQIGKGPSGGGCPAAGSAAANGPAFDAGTIDPSAGAYSPFVLRLARADGSQEIKAIDTTLPKGLIGKLAGIPYCSDAALAAAAAHSGRAEQASPSCGSASQVGSVDVGAGAGSQPLYVQGKAYLAGPYKGAPLSLAIVTPAVAGPFDLGTVVVRTALQVDPQTAVIRAVSDPIPTILQGIPLDVRSITLSADRPRFTLNPTSCDPMAVTGQAISVFDRPAGLRSPFQVGDCGELGFKPTLAFRLKGGTKRGKYPALTATLTARPGDANIARAVVGLPHSEFLAQEHIRTICTRVQFAAAQCPAGSVYGFAKATTPLLDKPLEGPVYLRSSSNPLPDLVAALDGQIDIDLVGRIDSVKGGIRNTFEMVPDAPVTKFTLAMKGGKKGLLVNSRDICRSVNRATVELDAQNGKTADQRPALKATCKAAGKGKKKRGGKHGGKPHKQG
jgi:hypothetical protein